VISAKRPTFVRFASRGGSNENGRSLTDLLKPTATATDLDRSPNPRLNRLPGSTLRFAVRPGVRCSFRGLSRHARGEIVGCVPLSMAVRRGMKLWGTIGYRNESVSQGPGVVRPGSADTR
jgi:hypothetical protein